MAWMMASVCASVMHHGRAKIVARELEFQAPGSACAPAHAATLKPPAA